LQTHHLALIFFDVVAERFFVNARHHKQLLCVLNSLVLAT
jgi:hypothetical protein